MYRTVLSGLTTHYGLGDGEVAAWLSRLQPRLIDLRRAYQNGLVNVDYSDSGLRDAYMLAYCTSSFAMADAVLRSSPPRVWRVPAGTFRVVAFAAGPAAELVALDVYLTECFPAVTAIEASLFDLHDVAWGPVRLCPGSPEGPRWTSTYSHIDLTLPTAFDICQTAIATANLVLFQNCLNELGQQGLESRIHHLGELLQPNTTALFIDLPQYDSVAQQFDAIQHALRARCDLRVNLTDGTRVDGGVPLELRNHFFADREFLRPKTDLNFGWLAMTRTY